MGFNTNSGRHLFHRELTQTTPYGSRSQLLPTADQRYGHMLSPWSYADGTCGKTTDFSLLKERRKSFRVVTLMLNSFGHCLQLTRLV
jgi:hypothetical protein